MHQSAQFFTAKPCPVYLNLVKFVFSKKGTKIDEIFTINLTLTTYIHELYIIEQSLELHFEQL